MKHISIILLSLILFIIPTRSYAQSYTSYVQNEYQPVSTLELATNPDKYDGLEVQIHGEISQAIYLIGRYGGEYVGITLTDGITVYVYKEELHINPRIGHILYVSGVFHKYSLFAGYGYSNFIGTRKIEKVE